TRAMKLKALGKDVVVLCDSDKDDKLVPSKQDLRDKQIKVFDWESNNSIEQQVFNDLPWEAVIELLQYIEKEFPETNIENSVKSKHGNHLPDNWRDVDAAQTRLAVGEAARSGEWFKRTYRGEFLGFVIFKYFQKIMNKKTKEQLNALIDWVDA
ncbi:MAG: hypothetical protein WCH62_07870, partial [Candidatus Omnitrophota bacterium]